MKKIIFLSPLICLLIACSPTTSPNVEVSYQKDMDNTPIDDTHYNKESKMTENKPSALEVWMKAYEESNGEYIDLVVEHGELAGITMEHLKWWGTYMNDPVRYKMWHPEDHISHRIKTMTDKDGKVVSIMYAEERIGDYGASVLRLRQEDPDSSPVHQVYKPVATNTALGPNDEVIGGVYHECEPSANGMLMRSTFRLPAKTPQEFLDAMYEHSKTEMGNLPKFLPELYAKEMASNNTSQ